MALVTGTALVLASWLFAALVLFAAGLLTALTVCGTRQFPAIVRYAVWWGLLAATLFVLAAGLWLPLGSPEAAHLGLMTLVGLGLSGAAFLIRRRPRWPRPHISWMSLPLTVTALCVTIYLAAAALGPVTNYDSGLYHLGAIQYAANFPAIPGLANLYFPFGYGTAQFPLAAIMTNGPWQSEGFRLLNGLLLALAALDLMLRLAWGRRGPGFYVLATGLLVTWIPMVALSDYWVTSPSQDSAVLTLTVVASAYFVDAVRGRRWWVSAALTGLSVSILATLIRPTMASFLFGGVVLVLALLWRRRSATQSFRMSGLLMVFLAGAAFLLTASRDRILSGWFLYPLSAFRFDVPWIADDPSFVRGATLGYHRNPNDLWNSATGWEWIGPWLTAQSAQWETYALLALAIVAFGMLVVARRQVIPLNFGRYVALSLLPSLIAVATWWLLSPPAFRFAWGALFTLTTIPIGWGLWALSRRRPTIGTSQILLAAATVPVLGVVAYSALFRLDTDAMTRPYLVQLGSGVSIQIAQVHVANVSPITLDSGLKIVRPIFTDQCWSSYPLCSPDPDPQLSILHSDWRNGFSVK